MSLRPFNDQSRFSPSPQCSASESESDYEGDSPYNLSQKRKAGTAGMNDAEVEKPQQLTPTPTEKDIAAMAPAAATPLSWKEEAENMSEAAILELAIERAKEVGVKFDEEETCIYYGYMLVPTITTDGEGKAFYSRFQQHYGGMPLMGDWKYDKQTKENALAEKPKGAHLGVVRIEKKISFHALDYTTREDGTVEWADALVNGNTRS
jgi:hypothetical protein